jgi:hypothetical protein
LGHSIDGRDEGQDSSEQHCEKLILQLGKKNRTLAEKEV